MLFVLDEEGGFCSFCAQESVATFPQQLAFDHRYHPLLTKEKEIRTSN